jgi:hypothetical protein
MREEKRLVMLVRPVRLKGAAEAEEAIMLAAAREETRMVVTEV